MFLLPLLRESFELFSARQSKLQSAQANVAAAEKSWGAHGPHQECRVLPRFTWPMPTAGLSIGVFTFVGCQQML